MAIWTKPGFENAAMLRHLEQLASGLDEWGRPVEHETRILASQRAAQLRAEQVRSAAESANAQTAAQRQLADAELTRAQALAESQKLEIEQQRLRLDEKIRLEELNVQKAEVFVKALAVAVEGGIDVKQLTAVVAQLGQQLTGSSIHALEGPIADLLELKSTVESKE